MKGIWLVSGYSNKADGVLIAVEAKEEEEAVKKAAAILELNAAYVKESDDEYSTYEGWVFSAEENVTKYSRWCIEVLAVRMEVGRNHHEIVQW